MKAKELRDLTRDELGERAKELSRELFNLRFQKATGQLGNTAMIPKTKRDLARVKTLLRASDISTKTK
ncbi:MAG: 50S ribosomal protein L29 [Desulfatiglandaceae bacterium]|jgi:large subunit ribosomal protein L29